MIKFAVEFDSPRKGSRRFAFLPEKIHTMGGAIEHVSVWDPEEAEDESQLAHFSGLTDPYLEKITVFEITDDRIINIDDLRNASRAEEEQKRRDRKEKRECDELARLIKAHPETAAQLMETS